MESPGNDHQQLGGGRATAASAAASSGRLSIDRFRVPPANISLAGPSRLHTAMLNAADLAGAILALGVQSSTSLEVRVRQWDLRIYLSTAVVRRRHYEGPADYLRRDQAALAVLFAAIGSVIFILIAATLYIAGYDNFALAPAIISIAIVAVRHLLGALPPRLDGNASKRRASLP